MIALPGGQEFVGREAGKIRRTPVNERNEALGGRAKVQRRRRARQQKDAWMDEVVPGRLTLACRMHEITKATHIDIGRTSCPAHQLTAPPLQSGERLQASWVQRTCLRAPESSPQIQHE